MVLTLDGHSEHVAQAWRKKGLFGEEKKSDVVCSRSNQKPLKDRITEIAPYMRTFSEFPSYIITMVGSHIV